MIYRRYLRHGNFDRVRHSEEFLEFLTEQALRLSGTGTPYTVTLDNTLNQVNVTNHGLQDGDGPIYLESAGGSLPPELANPDHRYWTNIVNANTFTLHLTQYDAQVGTNEVGFSTNGTGTITAYFAAELADIFYSMKDGKSAEEIRAVTTIDEL